MSQPLQPPKTHNPPSSKASLADLPLTGKATITGLLSFLLIGAAQAIYGPALPGLAEHFQLPTSTTGLLITVHGIGALIGVLGSVPLAAHGLARYRTGTAVLMVLAGGLLIGTAPAWWVALFGASLLGLGHGILSAGLNPLFAARFGARGPAMVNLLNALFGMGAIVGSLMVGVLEQPRLPFVGVALFAGLLLPFAFQLDDRVERTGAAQSVGRPGRTWYAFVLLLALAVGVEASSGGWTATYLVSQGSSVAAAAATTSLFYLVFTASRLLGMPLSQRFRPATLVAGALVLAAVLLGTSHFVPLAPYALVALGGAVSLFFPNIFSWLVAAQPQATRFSGLAIAAGVLGSALFPALVGQITAVTGKGSIPTVLLALSVMTLILAAVLRRKIPGPPAT